MGLKVAIMISKTSSPRPSAPFPEPSPIYPAGERRPVLPPPVRTDVSASPTTRPVPQGLNPLSTVHFWVHPQMPELVSDAHQRGWYARGHSQLCITWLELHYTTDGWKTAHVLRSTDVPCPIINGNFYLPNLPAGTQVEFALRVGYGCRAPEDTGGYRDSAEYWFNNQGTNYRQTTR